MKIKIKINDTRIIEDTNFKTYSCSSATTSSSLVIKNTR
ncbi:MAG: iron-sulfur cluster assembly scaffold protein [Arsenophonus sp. NC-WZS1-MAG3]